MLNEAVHCVWMEATKGVVAGMQPKVCAVLRRVDGVVVGGAFTPGPRTNGDRLVLGPVPAVLVRTDQHDVIACPLSSVYNADPAALADWHDAEWSAWLTRHGHAVPDTREARTALAATVLGAR